MDLLLIIYPLYMSLETLMKPKKDTLAQCLYFWVWYGTIKGFEVFLWWVPFWETMKLATCVAMMYHVFSSKVCRYVYRPVWRDTKKYTNKINEIYILPLVEKYSEKYEFIKSVTGKITQFRNTIMVFAPNHPPQQKRNKSVQHALPE